MDVETSIHWHGLLVPPDMDGVPNISFPPIKAGATFTYEFPIRQKGTYWYHSHTSLQEQRGVYGSIVIKSPNEPSVSDSDHVILLSDWTDEDPHDVLRTLKRGSEWYSLQKGSSQSIIGALRLGMLGSYFGRELQRMPAMDIADVAYDRFLANGKPESSIAALMHETMRLRIINGSATTYFYVEFAGGPMTIIGADGMDVVPFKEKRFLIGVAETYDITVKIPSTGKYEFRATAHDGSGYSTVWLGKGMPNPAPEVPRPNLYHPMGHQSSSQIFSLTPSGTMGMPDDKIDSGMFDKPGMMGMDMGSMSGMENMDSMNDKGSMKDMGDMESKDSMNDKGSMKDMGDTKSKDSMNDKGSMKDMGDMTKDGESKIQMKMGAMENDSGMKSEKSPSTQTKMPMTNAASPMKMDDKGEMPSSNLGTMSRNGKKFSSSFGLMAPDVSSSNKLAVDGQDMSRPWPPYAKLKAIKSTKLPPAASIRNIRMTLDGDMERYVWLINNKILSETDSIRIRQGEVVRFIMINRTMMHHPMHLHGHFFRVINGQGDRSPLKHTIDVAPMSTTVIEFEANEVGDWFFHCHLLYHMKSGMSRLIHYDEFTLNPELARVRPDLYDDPWYFWGQADMYNHMSEGNLMLSNTRNILTAEWEAGWQNVDNPQWEGILLWNRYINRFFTFFAGAYQEGEVVNDKDEKDESDEAEEKNEEDGEEENANKGRGVVGVSYLIPFNIESRIWVDSDGGGRVNLERSFELTPRFSAMMEAQYDSHEDWETSLGFSYMLHRNFFIITQSHSKYGLGAGLQVLF
jgi:FtsP/CotA-like multicopper oxidase with cupredoxin domain